MVFGFGTLKVGRYGTFRLPLWPLLCGLLEIMSSQNINPISEGGGGCMQSRERLYLTLLIIVSALALLPRIQNSFQPDLSDAKHSHKAVRSWSSFGQQQERHDNAVNSMGSDKEVKWLVRQ